MHSRSGEQLGGGRIRTWHDCSETKVPGHCATSSNSGVGRPLRVRTPCSRVLGGGGGHGRGSCPRKGQRCGQRGVTVEGMREMAWGTIRSHVDQVVH